MPIRSMTAYASGERSTPWGTLGCELRAVNHRFLELGTRLPDELRALEPALRERVAGRVSRGKLDLSLRLRQPDLVQRHGRVALPASERVPVGFAVSDEQRLSGHVGLSFEGFAWVFYTCKEQRVKADTLFRLSVSSGVFRLTSSPPGPISRS